MKRKIRIIVLFSLLLMSTFGILNFSSNNDSNTPISKPQMSYKSWSSERWTVDYNEYWAGDGVANNSIKWEFSSSIGVIILILDQNSYTSFVSEVRSSTLSGTVHSQSYVSSIISENRRSDSGTYVIPHLSTWYFIFVNIGNSQETCELAFFVEFDPWDPPTPPSNPPLSSWIGIIVGVVILGIIIVIVAFVVRSKRKSSIPKSRPIKIYDRQTTMKKIYEGPFNNNKNIKLMQDPNRNLKVLLNDSRIYFQQKNFQGAIQCFDQILQINPYLDDIWVMKGVAFQMIGDQDRALDCFNEALKLNPSNDKAQLSKVAIERVKQLKPVEKITKIDLTTFYSKIQEIVKPGLKDDDLFNVAFILDKKEEL